MAFIQRNSVQTISGLLSSHPLVLVEGPPRCGLSTLAGQLAAGSSAGAVRTDARLRAGRAMLDAPGAQSSARPIVMDNAGAADAVRLEPWARRVAGTRSPRFVLMGGPFPRGALSAPIVELGPLSLFEAGRASMRKLWLRGGYPEAYGAASDEAAAAWLEGYAADIAYGSLSCWGLPREPERISGLLRLVAESNGQAFNESAAARALGASGPTIRRYIDALEAAGILFSVPSIPPELARGSVRSARSAALYVRDSGFLHAVLGIGSTLELTANPGAAASSWCGFVAAQTKATMPPGAILFRYASADGASLELVITRDGKPVMAATANRHRPVSVPRFASFAARAIAPAGAAGSGGATDSEPEGGPALFIVCPDGEDRKLPGGFVATSLGAFLDRVASV